MRWIVTFGTLLFALLAVPLSVLAAGPTLNVVTPPDGVAQGSTVQIQLQITGMDIIPSTVPLSEAGKHPEANHPGQGHIHYILDLRPLAIQYHAGPIILTNVPVGEHTLMVELVNNDHSSLSPPVMQQIQFRTVPGALPSSGGGGMGAFPAVNRFLLLLVLGLVGGAGFLRSRRRA